MNLRGQLHRASHHTTWLLGTRFPKAIPLVFVVAYPKSGTSWVTQLVAHYLQLPFPRHSILPVGFKAVVHGHQRVWKSYPKGVYVLRDGRDAVVSAYFAESATIADGDHPRMTARQRRMFPGLVNKANVGENMAGFVERQMIRPQSSMVNWADHVRSYFKVRNPNVVLVRYEDLLRDGETTLATAMTELTCEEANLEEVRNALQRYSFQRQASRRPGREGSTWLRKGQAGDWRNYFTREAAEIFDRYCGDMLISTGYEPDHEWVRRLPAAGAESRPVVPTSATGSGQSVL